jgi:hypothetical protein
MFHLETTKNILMSKMFASNAIEFHTSSDYYTDHSIANLAVKKHINTILESMRNGSYDNN